MLKRMKHWDTRGLDPFFKARAQKPFVWGEHDCCLFAADAIEAITGFDIADDFRGRYHDEKTAFLLIRLVTGGTTVADAAAHCAVKHGLIEYKHPRMAQRGDLVVMENGGSLIAGVVHLNGRHLVSVAESGPVRLSILSVVRAWRY
jgi:hypothetical protein